MLDLTDPIEVLLDDVVLRLRAFDRLDQHWLLTTVLDELDFAHGVGAHDDAVENVRDVGEGVVTTVALAVQRHPERTGDVYRAAHGVVERLLNAVPGPDRRASERREHRCPARRSRAALQRISSVSRPHAPRPCDRDALGSIPAVSGVQPYLTHAPSTLLQHPSLSAQQPCTGLPYHSCVGL